jgi:hypothetical protein
MRGLPRNAVDVSDLGPGHAFGLCIQQHAALEHLHSGRKVVAARTLSRAFGESSKLRTFSTSVSTTCATFSAAM